MKKFFEEFKKFISRGNVMDMAVGVIIGSAFGKIVSSIVDDILMPLIGVIIGGSFGKIVTSLVNDIITPIIGIIIGGIDFSNLSIQINEAKIMYGNFIQTIIDFLIIAICIFSVTRTFEKIKNKNKKEEAVVEPPKKSDEVLLLEEIRDLLKKETSKKEEEEKV